MIVKVVAKINKLQKKNTTSVRSESFAVSAAA